MIPPRPARLERLPEQFFTGILAAAARARAQPGPPVIDLGRGNPDLPPPQHALDACAAALAQTATPAVHGYPPFDGHRSLREAIAARYAADHGVTLDPDREVAVVPGTKTAITLVALALAQAGDVILVPDPGYPDYHSGVALSGARGVALPLEASAGWQPDWDALAPADVAAARMAYLNYPSNPCAVLAAPGTLESAVAFAHRHDTVLVHDLAYGFLAFGGGRGRSVLEVEGARDVAVELWSASKIYGMAGWRIGFVVGCADVVTRVQELLDHVAAGIFTATQRGLQAALEGDQRDVAARAAVYAARRERLAAAALPGLEAPEGSFYAWWRLPAGLTAARLLEEQRVAVAPGEGFGARGAGWARLSLALPDEALDEGLRRLGEATAPA
jgi:aminotransferase